MRRIGLSGNVVTQFIVGPDGDVRREDIEIISTPHPDFTDAVRDAVASWKFEPGLEEDGRTVATRVRIRIPFRYRGRIQF